MSMNGNINYTGAAHFGPMTAVLRVLVENSRALIGGPVGRSYQPESLWLFMKKKQHFFEILSQVHLSKTPTKTSVYRQTRPTFFCHAIRHRVKKGFVPPPKRSKQP